MPYRLLCHPDMPSTSVRAIDVEVIAIGPRDVSLEYRLTGASRLVVPESRLPVRTDGLWQATCFELFLGGEDERYLEFNFSPSGQWAAYSFDGYRAGMCDLPLAIPPRIRVLSLDDGLIVQVDFDPGAFAKQMSWAGLAAVIAETDGTRSYWALAHPPGQPDFHHPDCFALELPAAG